MIGVPGRRDVLEGNFELAPFAGRERLRAGEDRAGLAQNDLVKLIIKLDGDFGVAKRLRASIDGFSGERGDLLLKKVFGAFEADVFDMNVRSIGLLEGAKRKPRLGGGRSRMPGRTGGNIEIRGKRKNQERGHDGHPRKPRGRFLVAGNFERKGF